MLVIIIMIPIRKKILKMFPENENEVPPIYISGAGKQPFEIGIGWTNPSPPKTFL